MEAVERSRPDLVVLDVRLDGGDGFGVVDDLRRRGLVDSAPILVYSVLELDEADRDRLQTIGVTDPDTGEDVRTGDIIPDVAVDPASGRLYAVWQDARFSGFANDSIAFSQSLDDGLTWSNPIKINKTPDRANDLNEQAFTASVDVAADGTISATYYDFRNNDGGTDLVVVDGPVTADFELVANSVVTG